MMGFGVSATSQLLKHAITGTVRTDSLGFLDGYVGFHVVENVVWSVEPCMALWCVNGRSLVYAHFANTILRTLSLRQQTSLTTHIHAQCE